ncbi:putative ABC transporter ATP-binding protein [Gordonia araii NBRC 100433]|uniref:Putative ABC transporter ATP-binding protein n=1 Tax=Gordonia araii NBRC 100433 TaxID=1073574 RepID=G7H5R7_9ACTN|nr:ABC-F family ATP-binding cassette domain-containing protein [Gordonia araii]NNG95902.1 ABC-F family ATP-binding cassette domain-containing protein [Gordonia araii NBRC 100433]GAB11192.1 putative ABC transporter ATP-binding protein [Gordonia araii NBRC 100433]
MSIPHNPAVVLSDLSFSWPDGTPVFTGVDAAFGAGRTGLIGTNGSGKSTLLRLVAGELTPSSGRIDIDGVVGYLPQQLTLKTNATVADLLGIRVRLDALRAIESGDTDPRRFDELGDDWDAESRARAALDVLGLSSIGLDRPVSQLSGGETVLAALAGLRLAGDEVVLLDEPTNNLDRQARHGLYDAVTAWSGALIVVSHDVTLLDLLDETAELRSGSMTVFGGPFSAYREYVAAEQAAAQQAVRSAEQELKKEKRQRVEAETKLARRSRYAKTDFENKRKPKIIMNMLKGSAQVSAGKLRGQLDGRVEAAREELDSQEARLRDDARIRIDLPDPGVSTGRRLAELHDGRHDPIVIAGPERVALTGRNGIGKTRLLESLFADDESDEDRVRAIAQTGRIGYLPQRLDNLDDESTIFEAVRQTAQHTPAVEIRAQLARFLFRADDVLRPIGVLSGGERFRVALARLLLADPPNQLLILDEPTNNLDLASIDELVDALDAYRGGLIVVSHDDAFLERLRIDTRVVLDDDGLAIER